MLTESIYFYILSGLLVMSGVLVIFAPRMFLALIGLFLAFLFSGLLCITLNAKFVGILLFAAGALILCPVIFLLMKKIKRWNLPLKLVHPGKLIFALIEAVLFGVMTFLFLKEEFSGSFLNLFNYLSEKSTDSINLKMFIFPEHLAAILFLITVIVVHAVVVSSNTGEDCDD